jgi:hypothetical protein
MQFEVEMIGTVQVTDLAKIYHTKQRKGSN